ncbi:hypothetical protein, conserved [Leishmania lindenbergi]|uniref:Uncharacterized protein n=1 Tax=Leishmania lindenbergi TaxID=651832 RepID=A0AAW3ADV7_9TRYP
MFGFGSFGGVTSSGAPPPIGAPGRGGGVLGMPSSAVFPNPGEPALMSVFSNSRSNASVLHDSFNSQSRGFSSFSGGSQVVPPPVLDGAVSIKANDASNITSYGGDANMSVPQRGVLPGSRSALPLSAIPVFGTGEPSPPHSSGPSPIITAPTAVTVPPPASFAAMPSSAIQVSALPAFTSVPPPPPTPASSGKGILDGSGSSVRNSVSGSFTTPWGGQESKSANREDNNAKGGGDSRPVLPEPRSSDQSSQESRAWRGTTSALYPAHVLPKQFVGCGSDPQPSSTFPGAATVVRSSDNNKRDQSASVSATAAPVLSSAATQSRPGASDAGGSILSSAFGALSTTSQSGNAASSPQPPPPSSSVFGASVPRLNASATSLFSALATSKAPEAAPSTTAVKGTLFKSSATAAAAEPASLPSVTVPPSSAFGVSVFRKASAVALAAPPPAVTPAALPPPVAAKIATTSTNRSSSVFGELNSSFGAPPPASSLGQRAAQHGGSHAPASHHASPFAPSPLLTGPVFTPATTTSAFGAAASRSGPGVGGGPGTGGSVFTAVAATPARASAPSFLVSTSPGKTPPSLEQSKALGSGADRGRAEAVAGRRRGRSAPRRNAAEDDSSGPVRPHPGSLTATASPPVQGSRSAIPPLPHGQYQSPPSPPHKQRPPAALSRLEKLSIPPLPADEKKLSIAARLCKSFLIQLASSRVLGGHGGGGASGGGEVDVARALEQAFFGVVGSEGVHGNFGMTAGEMLALWYGQVRPMLSGRDTHGSDDGGSAFPGEMWIALFALGTYLNTILSTLQSGKTGSRAASSSASASMTDLAAYKAGLRAHPTEALTDACHYANELSELLQALFQRGDEADAPPYSVIPVVLRRVRSVFEEATARGVATVQSNLNTVTSKLFSVLNRRVKTSAVQPLGTPGEAPRWLLTYDSKEKENLLHSFAYLIMEMIAADAPMNDDVELFISAFHEGFPSALAERCMLYYRHACALLRQPLCMSLVEEAAALLVKATVVYPPNAPLHNMRVLLVKLLATELALGRLPPDEDWLALDVPQLIDVVNALKTARLDLLDAALATHGPFFVGAGVHNVLCLARQRLALLMVVKFYLTHGCESRLCVSEMVRYHRLPYSTVDAGVAWLLPLLVEKQMNGVLDHDYLILSAKAPFDAYQREALADAAATARHPPRSAEDV